MKIVPNLKRSDRSLLAGLVGAGVLALVILSPKHLTYAGRSGYFFGAKDDNGTVTILSTKPCEKLADARALAVLQYGKKAEYIAPAKTDTVVKAKRKQAA